MQSNYAPAIEYIVENFEGGFSNDPHDPGGATYQGVTQNVYDAYRLQHHTFRRPVINMELQERNDIYKFFWDAVRGDNLASGLDLAVFDDAINAGPAAAIKTLQKSLGVKVDGHMGPVTIQALKDTENVKHLIQVFSDNRMAFLRNLGTWRYFSVGWQSRVDAVTARAFELCNKGSW